jgi:O-succinylbenzoate synthase
VSTLAFAPYARPFTRPFSYGKYTLSSRTGFILRLSLEGNVFFSEAAPLPGHSTDALADVEKALSTHSCGTLMAASPDLQIPPSLRFALESLTAQSMPGTAAVRSNALVPKITSGELRNSLSAAVKSGYTHCKIKVSPDSWSGQVDVLEEFPQLIFRLDANLSLAPQDLDKIVSDLSRRALLKQLDYLEEPFPGIWDQASFRGIPLALAADESAPSPLRAMDLLETANPPSVFIIKPSVAGGLFSLSESVECLKRAEKRVVFTSALETEPGRRSLLAFLSQMPHEPCGLSVGGLFEKNYLPDAPVWISTPGISAEEQRFLGSLPWRDCQ